MNYARCVVEQFNHLVGQIVLFNYDSHLSKCSLNPTNKYFIFEYKTMEEFHANWNGVKSNRLFFSIGKMSNHYSQLQKYPKCAPETTGGPLNPKANPQFVESPQFDLSNKQLTPRAGVI